MTIFPKDFDPIYEDYVTKFLEYEQDTEDYLWNKGDLLVDFTSQPPAVLGPGGGLVHKTLRALASDVMRHHKTLERWRFTSYIFPPDKRIADLSFSHHTAAAYSTVPEFWIQEAADKEWSTHQLKEAIKAKERPGESWVSKTLRGTAELQIHETEGAEYVSISGIGYELLLDAKSDDPIRLNQKWKDIGIDVEVEASIKVRKKSAKKTV